MRMCPHRIGEEIEFNDSTDPNVLWATTSWTQVTDGRVTLASSSAHVLNSTGGVETKSYTPAGTVDGHALTVNEIPSHTHAVPSINYTVQPVSGNNTAAGTTYHRSGATQASGGAGGGGSHNHGFTGTAATLNIMQPWRAVNRWRRVA